MRLRAYFHRGRHRQDYRPGMARLTVQDIASRRGHIVGTLPGGERILFGSLRIERWDDLTESWQFLDRAELTTK